VEVVPEQESRVAIGRGEQARPSVVEQIALVDRLEAEGEALFPERREDRLELALGGRAQAGLPEWALARGLAGDRVPEAAHSKNSAAASSVRSISLSPWASDTNIASNCEGAT